MHQSGVFDSGVGGLTVAREIMRQLPEESMIYFWGIPHVYLMERSLRIRSCAIPDRLSIFC